ncbi:proteasome assembly chaperone family protein [Candidatus Woesearchaeota archaeon]|nr:proteasome assembly chaperone family protein [Candidatus Woesearchaeota archaeon]
MELKLIEKPKNPIIIEGFPGLGLIGTISTEYLIKHLGAKSIGHISSKKIAPMVAVHESKLVQPLEVFYAKSKNIIILHALADIRGMEWDIADALQELYVTLKAKEVISVEGILGQNKDLNVYYYTNDSAVKKKMDANKVGLLQEGIVSGVTAALLLKENEMATTGFFVETHSKLPDSRAAAKIIELLDSYLKLGVDIKPLEKAAADFEKQLQDYVEKMQDASKKTDEKAENYFG